MADPIVGGEKPCVLDVAPGAYFWCACGRSKSQPYCDGSHQGTGIEPKEVIITTKQRVAFCACKKTGNPPFCDGSHKLLLGS
jgi:CDGSH-type Zn-finger protein